MYQSGAVVYIQCIAKKVSPIEFNVRQIGKVIGISLMFNPNNLFLSPCEDIGEMALHVNMYLSHKQQL